jgi:hypothetical protein
MILLFYSVGVLFLLVGDYFGGRRLMVFWGFGCGWRWFWDGDVDDGVLMMGDGVR